MSQNWQIAGDIFWVSMISGVGAWLFIRSFKRSDDRPRLIFKWAVTAVVVALVLFVVVPDFREVGEATPGALILMLICGLAMVITWRHSIIEAIARPLTSAMDGGNEPPEPKPYYSVALAKRKLKKPLEAMVEVQQATRQFPERF